MLIEILVACCILFDEDLSGFVGECFVMQRILCVRGLRDWWKWWTKGLYVTAVGVKGPQVAAKVHTIVP